MDEAFTAEMAAGYAFDEPCVILGRPMKDGGLVAGATGTGKTKTLQIMAGQLSAAGVPVFISDIKGDVTPFCRSSSTGCSTRSAPSRPMMPRTCGRP